MNKAIVSGRLGRDPELRFTSGGTPICNFSVATSHFSKGEEKTEWHNIVAIGNDNESNLATRCGQYLQKGAQVLVEGRLQTRSWESDGVTRKSTEIVANFVEFLSGFKTKEEAQRGTESEVDPDDLPF